MGHDPSVCLLLFCFLLSVIISSHVSSSLSSSSASNKNLMCRLRTCLHSSCCWRCMGELGQMQFISLALTIHFSWGFWLVTCHSDTDISLFSSIHHLFLAFKTSVMWRFSFWNIIIKTKKSIDTLCTVNNSLLKWIVIKHYQHFI